jgi:hypothetical protein
MALNLCLSRVRMGVAVMRQYCNYYQLGTMKLGRKRGENTSHHLFVCWKSSLSLPLSRSLFQAQSNLFRSGLVIVSGCQTPAKIDNETRIHSRAINGYSQNMNNDHLPSLHYERDQENNGRVSRGITF